MEYTILSARTLNDIQAYVDSAISDGWLPLGGIQINNNNKDQCVTFYQSMVKEDTENRDLRRELVESAMESLSLWVKLDKKF